MIRPPHGLFPTILLLPVFGSPVRAQFKEVGPPPYSQAVARQKIRTQIDKVNPDNPQPTVDALFALAPWYRDLLDEELVAAWQKDSRMGVAPLLEPLADAHMAAAIIDYSWRRNPEGTFNLTFAPMLGRLMARYPDSGTPFLADLLAPAVSGRPPLTHTEAAAVCRILIDMPDTGNWKKAAQQILPRYRQVAEDLLNADLKGTDREKAYQAQMWMRQLEGDQPAAPQPLQRRKSNAAPPPPVTTADANPPSNPSTRTVDGRPTLVRPDPDAPPPSLNRGATSGTLQCSGGPIPQNAEYVFRNLPPGNIQVTLDIRVWEARLVPDGQTQKLIIRNVSSGPQKRCSIRWSLMP